MGWKPKTAEFVELGRWKGMKGLRGEGRNGTGTEPSGTKHLKNGSNKSKQHGLTYLQEYSKSYLT